MEGEGPVFGGDVDRQPLEHTKLEPERTLFASRQLQKAIVIDSLQGELLIEQSDVKGKNPIGGI